MLPGVGAVFALRVSLKQVLRLRSLAFTVIVFSTFHQLFPAIGVLCLGASEVLVLITHGEETGKTAHILGLTDSTKKEIDFTNTSFFTTSPNRHLPTPAQVRALSKDIDTSCQPTPIKFRNLNLIVKFGLYVTIVEALNLWMVKKVFHDRVPVPELFGWRVDDEGYVFIYMELIEGPTLDECWNRLGAIEKRAISDQLSRMAETLRQLEQDPSDQFIVSKSSTTGSLIPTMVYFRIMGK
ncbi:phosphotransferase enzyme family protein [Aspergillus flavus AF70]|nr:phosphotransferase enzyme family protein [Aspergillus flavus AF70]